jgi:hypothetical protein
MVRGKPAEGRLTGKADHRVMDSGHNYFAMDVQTP